MRAWAIHDLSIARPFLLGMPAADIKKKFTVTVIKNESNEARLNLIPRDRRLAASLTKAVLILDRETWLAKALKIHDPTGAESVHVFKNMRVNSPVESADDLSKPNLEGYREIITEKVRQKDSTK